MRGSSGSRVKRIHDLLLRRQAGEKMADPVVDESCIQLLARLEDEDPAEIPGNAGKLCLERLVDVLSRDYVARALATSIEPIEVGKIVRRRQVRILFLCARPDGSKDIRADREYRELSAVLRNHERLILDLRLAVRHFEFRQHLLDFDPDILHFSGHGEDGSIMLEGRNGETEKISGSKLAELFRILNSNLRCVVLNACESSLEGVKGIAESVGVVVARDRVVSNSAAIMFSTYFYDGLARGQTPRQAHEQACWEVAQQSGGGALAIPQLLGNAVDTPLLCTGKPNKL